MNHNLSAISLNLENATALSSLAVLASTADVVEGITRLSGAGESPTLIDADTNEEVSALYPIAEYELAKS